MGSDFFCPGAFKENAMISKTAIAHLVEKLGAENVASEKEDLLVLGYDSTPGVHHLPVHQRRARRGRFEQGRRADSGAERDRWELWRGLQVRRLRGHDFGGHLFRLGAHPEEVDARRRGGTGGLSLGPLRRALGVVHGGVAKRQTRET